MARWLLAIDQRRKTGDYHLTVGVMDADRPAATPLQKGCRKTFATASQMESAPVAESRDRSRETAS